MNGYKKMFILLLKKNCFVKEKWKKESFVSSGCLKGQSLFDNLLHQYNTAANFAFAFSHWVTKPS